MTQVSWDQSLTCFAFPGNRRLLSPGFSFATPRILEQNQRSHPEPTHARMTLHRAAAAALLLFTAVSGFAQSSSTYQSSDDFAKYAMKLRENALLRVEPQVFIPTAPSTPYGYGSSAAAPGSSMRYPWKRGIVTTVFWVGELPTKNNPVSNLKSSWDVDWRDSFGGFDNPDPRSRRGFLPAGFIPRQNPFYVALPYNDVTRGATKPEAARVIPWFRTAFTKPGTSVCKGRWVAIRKGNRVAYAQWEDCGPFRTDHWQYVFGNARPLPNLNKGAGLDVSPAVRDYLGMTGMDVTDWRFVDFREVPNGPWSLYGDNNTFVINKRRAAGQALVNLDISYRNALAR